MISPEELSHVPLVDRLSSAARAAISSRASVRRVRAGEVLWTVGSPVDYMLIVIEGQVRVIREAGGRQHVLHTEGPGGTLGEVPFYNGGVASATAIAVVPTQCLVLSREAIEAAIAADPKVAWVLLARLAARVRVLVERVDRLALKSATRRLAALLLEHAERAPVPDGVVTLGMTQAVLAQELGTVREVVVRALRWMRERGMISPAGPGKLRIVDLAALRHFVAADE